MTTPKNPKPAETAPNTDTATAATKKPAPSKPAKTSPGAASKPKTAVAKPKEATAKPKAAATKPKTAPAKAPAASKTSAQKAAAPKKETIPPSIATETVEPVAQKTAKPSAGKILQRAARKTAGNTDIRQKAALYWRLMRMDRPIGTLLLLWPTLWSLWIAAKGIPSIKNLVIFTLGVIVMRAAGCVINDFADRKIDGKVKRTKDRPLATGAVSTREAIGLFIALCLIAFGLVLMTDPLTIKLSVGGLILAFCYPFMKRHTHLPQVVLGAAFAWGIPMAYAAQAGELHQGMWLIYLAVVLWTVAYDTFYAMVDRDDDLKIGVKSTAILFGEQDRLITGMLQVMALYALLLVGDRFELGAPYFLGLAAAAALFAYQQWLIRFRKRDDCFKAFLNNNWVGVAVFVGIAADYALG